MSKRPMPEPTSFRRAQGRLIAQAMAAKKITQKALQDRVGLSQSSISAVINGRQTISSQQLAKIAEVLEVSANSLMPTFEALEAARQEVAKPEVTLEPVPMSVPQRKLQATREDFLDRFAPELGPADIQHVKAVAFLTDPGISPDDQYWWDIVESGRRRRERARLRGDGGKTQG